MQFAYDYIMDPRVNGIMPDLPYPYMAKVIFKSFH